MADLFAITELPDDWIYLHEFVLDEIGITNLKPWQILRVTTSSCVEENVVNANFMQQGRVPSGGDFVTRRAPAIGDNPGGGIEVVTPSGGADLDWFFTAGPKG